MKRFILTMVTMLTILTGAKAMTYSQARDEALFLTDKMAYELNLNEQQYEAAYEINLDYLMGVTTVDDVYADGWRQRNIDLEYIMYDWQYSAYCAASYFFRPLFWDAGYWHFGIYSHYPHRDYFYFSRPACWNTYRGGHGWRMNGGRSWYGNRRSDYHRGGVSHVGMRDNWRGGQARGANVGRAQGGYRGNNVGRGNNNVGRPNNNNVGRGNNNNVGRSNNIGTRSGNSSINRGNNNVSRPGNNNGFNRGDNNVNRGNSNVNRGNSNVGRPNDSGNRNSSTRATVGSNQPSRSSSSSTRSSSAPTRGGSVSSSAPSGGNHSSAPSHGGGRR